MVAIYSSRRGPARPTPMDVRMARLTSAFYVYVSVDTEPNVRAFRMTPSGAQEHGIVTV